jgi:hypothetical protein
MSKKTAKKHKKMERITVVLLIILSLAMIIVLQLGFIFFLMSMLPTVVAYYVDSSRAQSTFHTVFACNLAGVLPFLERMLRNDGHGSSTALIMTDAVNWLIVYLSAGIGWLLVLSMPIAAEFFIRNLHKRQVSRLERVQRRIEHEWGEDIRQINIAPKRKD